MRNNRRFFAVALWLGTFWLNVVAGFAQQTPSISGSVKNAVDGSPVLRAHVRIQSGQKQFGALTDASGNFTIAGIEPGDGFVSVERVGFARSFQPQTVHVNPGEKKTGVDLKLTPTGGIVGTVVDPDGEPVQSAQVTASSGNEEASAMTDSHGRYRLGGLNPGKYRVRASVRSEPLPPETRTDGTQDVHYAAVFYPGVPTSQEATRVSVQPGQDTQGIDVRLVASPIVRVTGKVVNAPAGPLGLEIMHAFGRSGFEGNAAAVNPDGSFVLWGLDPGKYTLTARGRAGVNGPQSAPTEIMVGTTNIDEIELRMQEPMEIAGRIQFEDEDARKKATPPPEVPAEERTLHIGLRPMTEQGNSFSASVGPDSTFRIERVPAGKYRLEMGVYGGAFVKSMSWGSVQIDGNVLDTEKGSGRSELVVTISSKAAKIHGIVSNSKGPAANVTVHVLMEGSDVPVPTDSMGMYSFDELPPGSYRLLAVDKSLDQTEIAFQGGDEFSDYEDSMVKVEVKAGADITQDLKLTNVD